MTNDDSHKVEMTLIAQEIRNSVSHAHTNIIELPIRRHCRAAGTDTNAAQAANQGVFT